jgi:hypothetical protein
MCLYLDDHSIKVADSSKATSKIIYHKYLEDTTLWSASQLSMNNQLEVEGVYKDRGLSIPHGLFKYYYNGGTTHYLKVEGYYYNGIKYGAWTEYFPNRKKSKVTTLRGAVLDGPYEVYNGIDSIPIIKGQYIKGQKDGEWTNINVKEIYKDGIKIETVPNNAFDLEKIAFQKKRDSLKAARHFIDAKEPPEFANYMRKKLDFYFSYHSRVSGLVSIVIIFTVDEEGKPINGKALGNLNSKFNDKIALAINSAPLWKPALSNGKPVSETITYNFTEDRASITFPSTRF